jgi:hypothetical protein
MSRLQSDKSGKAEKIAKAEKLEKQAWIEKMERAEKLRGVRAMDPLEAHMLRKITAGVDTMIMSNKHKEFLAEETGSLSGDSLPPYSEVDLQGRVTQGDRLNALKRERAHHHHHHHHSRLASADRHLPEQALLMGRTRQQTSALRKSAAAAAAAMVSSHPPPSSPPLSHPSSSSQLPATTAGKPMMTRSRAVPSRGVTVQALEPPQLGTLPSILPSGPAHRPSRVRGNSSARTTVRPAMLAAAGMRDNL